MDVSDDAFEAWVEYLFDRPPSELEPIAWYHGEETLTTWDVYYADSDTPVAQAERIRRLFSNAGPLLRPYTDQQVGHGLNFIVNPACGGEIWVLAGHAIPPAVRVAGLRSIVTLFTDVFAPRLRVPHPRPADPDPALIQGSGGLVHPLDFVCDMFWDVAPLVPRRDDDARLQIIAAKLEVLEATLALDSTACQHAALHGLGHEHQEATDEVPEIIHRWLRRNPHAPEELRAYAAQAAIGSVL